MSKTPRRFSKRSDSRYKAVRKIVRKVKAPEGVVIIPGRTAGFSDHVYVEVYCNERGYGERTYFDFKDTNKRIRNETKWMIREVTGK